MYAAVSLFSPAIFVRIVSRTFDSLLSSPSSSSSLPHSHSTCLMSFPLRNFLSGSSLLQVQHCSFFPSPAAEEQQEEGGEGHCQQQAT